MNGLSCRWSPRQSQNLIEMSGIVGIMQQSPPEMIESLPPDKRLLRLSKDCGSHKGSLAIADDVRLIPTSGGIADIPKPTLWANKRRPSLTLQASRAPLTQH